MSRFPLFRSTSGLRQCASIASVFYLMASAALAQTVQPRSVKLDPGEASRLSPIPGTAATPVETPAPGAAPSATQLQVQYDPKEAERFRVIRKNLSPEQPGQYELRIKPIEGYIDYDEVEQIIYGPTRTQIWYGKYYLEADKVILDNRLQEIQAEGNVIFRSADPAYQNTEMHASSMRFNFLDNEGVAFNVEGTHPPIYFRAPSSDEEALPPFQQVSAEESIFRNTSITTCDFKVPHYSLRGREMILFVNDRAFIRGATLRVWGVPVFYLPYYVKSLEEPGPWFVELGYSTRTGARVRVGYNFSHSTDEPTMEDETKYENRSRGNAQIFADYLSKRGYGGGFNYDYSLDFDKHVGDFRVYGIDDHERTVSTGVTTNVDPLTGVVDQEDNTKGSPERSAIFWNNRSEITKHLYAHANVDWISDPEIFYDVLDYFNTSKDRRDRQIQRRARGTITYLREAYVARLMVEAKDRIGIDRYYNFSDPNDDNRDYEFQPLLSLEDSEATSIGRNRWGRVTERYPQFTSALRYLPIKHWPLYYMNEVTIYNNLDKGLNIVSDEDDARVQGFDAYNQLLWQYRITERYVLLAKLGGEFGVAERSRDGIGIDFGDIPHAPGTSLFDPGPLFVDSLNFIDDDGTFLIGKKKYNLDNMQRAYGYGDADVRFNARLSDALTGIIAWKFRETTDNFIGDFYANVGDRLSRQDLFDYRLKQHLIQGNLSYRLVYPSIYTFANASANLKSKSERYPNEDIGYWNIGAGWANRKQTLRLTNSLGWVRRQLLAPSAFGAGEQENTFFRADLRYTPTHQRWYTLLRFDRDQSHGETTEPDDSEDFTFFTDEDPETRLDLVYGREFGPKWNSEIKFEWNSQVDGLREVSWLLQRDLHDAFAILQVRSKREIEDATTRSDNPQELDISFHLKFKLPERPTTETTPKSVRTVREPERAPALAF